MSARSRSGACVALTPLVTEGPSVERLWFTALLFSP